MGLPRRHRAGRDRHVVRARHAADARASRGATSRAIEAALARARRRAPRHAHARPHARAARPADHVRLQGRGLGGRGAPPPRADRPGRAAPRRRPARRRRRHAVELGRPRPRAPAPRCSTRLGLARPGHQLDQRARPDRRVRRAARHDHGHAGQDRQRGLQPPAPGDRRALRGADARRRRQHHDAAEAQPGALRAPRRRSRGSSAPTPGSRSRAWSPSTSATARPGRPSGRSCRAPAAPPPPRSPSAASSSPASACTPDRMRANLDAQDGYVLAEPAMLALADAARQAPRARARPPGGARGAGDAASRSPRRCGPTPRSRGTSPPDRLAALLRPERRARRGRPARRRRDRARMTDEPPEGYLGADRADPPRTCSRAGRRRLRARAGRRAAARARPRAGRPRARRRARRDPGRGRAPRCARALLELLETPPDVDPRYGDLVNVRERQLEQRVGTRGRLAERRAARAARPAGSRSGSPLRGLLLDLGDALVRFAAALVDARRARARHADARLHLPAGRAADDRRALAAVVRLPGAARPRAPRGRPRVGQPQPRRRGRRQRLALRDRPRAPVGPARLRRPDRAHARRDVADRRADRGRVARRHGRHEREPPRRGPRALRQRRVRAPARSATSSAARAR